MRSWLVALVSCPFLTSSPVTFLSEHTLFSRIQKVELSDELVAEIGMKFVSVLCNALC